MPNRDLLIRKWFNALFILISLYVFAYPVGRLTFWFCNNAIYAWIAAFLVWILTIASSRYVFSGPKMKPRYFVVHWMGISFVMASVTLGAEVTGVFTTYSNSVLANSVLLTSALVIVIAVILSHHLAIKTITIKTDKVDKKIRIAQLSDVHIGSRQKGFMARIVNKVNAQNPDFVTITGDLIDSSAVGIDALHSISQLKAVTLFSIGNHERYADLPKMIDMAEQLGMNTLRQQSYMTEQIHFSGIDDADDPGQVEKHLPHLPLNPDKFNILLYHRPVGWEAAVEHGIDLMLSGHTHNGQIFPFNLLVKQQFSRISGLYSQGSAHLYVSSGTGTWGPLMRLGSLNEITLFDLVPINTAD